MALGNGSTAIGRGARSDETGGIALGNGAIVTHGLAGGVFSSFASNSIAIGTNAKATGPVGGNGDEAVVIGMQASSAGFRNIAIGGLATVENSTDPNFSGIATNRGIAIGSQAKVTPTGNSGNADDGIAIGTFSTAGRIGVAIGPDAVASGGPLVNLGNVAVGRIAAATGNNATALGAFAKATGDSGIAIGSSLASGADAIALGRLANAAATGSIAIGQGAFIDNSADGLLFPLSSPRSVAIGLNSNVRNSPDSVALGSGSQVSGDSFSLVGQATALGAQAFVHQQGGTSVGFGSKSCNGGLSLGQGAVTGTQRNFNSDSSGRDLPGGAVLVCDDINGAQPAASTAVGNNATASGAKSVALGTNAKATADGAVALGADTLASSFNNVAIGARSLSTADPTTAVGADTVASGNNASVFGANAQGTATNATAIGQGSIASGANATALGQGATATGNNSTALGQGAQASFSNSTAIGAGAVTTAPNQVVIGGPGTTVAFPSIVGGQGNQVGPTNFVTSDGSGRLATAGFGPDEVLRQDRRLRDGVALAIAAGGSPQLLPGRRFALSANVGTFDGAGAFSAGATALLFDTKQYAVVANASAGIGLNTNVIGGRGGLSVQW